MFDFLVDLFVLDFGVFFVCAIFKLVCDNVDFKVEKVYNQYRSQ